MTLANGTSRARDDLLDEVVTAILEYIEDGQALNAQEWLTRYPEFASDLEAFFTDQDKVSRWTAPLRESTQPISALDNQPHSPGPTKVGLFGDYILFEEISRGGMGIIYLARQISLNRLVAVKMIRVGPMASNVDVQRFHAEAIAAARLDHPNIVPIYEVGEVDGQHFYSMKVMEGGSLSERGAELKGRPKVAAALLAKVARAVHHAHQRGVLHRDLKPGNVLLDGAGEPHVSDFGLAKRKEDVTESGVIVGTPSYMAPEQAAGQKTLTTAADVYGVGAILYTLLTGKPPFQAETRLETLRMVAENMPASPRALNSLVDRDLETICLKCLGKSASQRYADAQALADDLERYLASEPIEARPIPGWKRGLKWAKRRPALAALVVISFTTVLSLIVGYLQYQERRVVVAEQALTERRRTDSLRSEVQSLILKGQEAMSHAHWSDAKLHLSSARRLLQAEPALIDMEIPVERLLVTTDHGLQTEVKRREAESKYLRFKNLRDQAVFLGTLFTGVDLPANLNKLRETVWAALSSVGVTVETAAAGPVFDEPFTSDERKEIQEGCYELLLILAETFAHDSPPRVEQSLRILHRADEFGQPTKAHHLRRTRYLKQIGDEVGARNESDRAAARQPAGAIDYFLMGEELHRQGNVVEAIRAFKNALRCRPDHFWARYLLSVCYLRLQPARADLASDALTACLLQGRNVPWVYLLRGLAHGQLELYHAAEDDFQKALEHHPNDEAIYAILVNRGVLFSRQRKYAQAVADLKQAVDVKPPQELPCLVSGDDVMFAAPGTSLFGERR
jgi:serine/threonine protein kinase/Flp pilus assembly protein TadD